MKKLPVARTQNLVMQDFNKEVLLYDLLTNKAYCLNETSAIVYLACDGKTDFNDLISKHQFTEELIYLSLQVLQKDNLIEHMELNYFGDLSRREIIKKVGLASMIALPMIFSLISPTAANAASGCSNGGTVQPAEPCTFDNNTQSDCCFSDYRCHAITGNTCALCYPDDTAATVSSPGFFTQSSCDTSPIRNACCSGNFTVSPSGHACICTA